MGLWGCCCSWSVLKKSKRNFPGFFLIRKELTIESVSQTKLFLSLWNAKNIGIRKSEFVAKTQFL